MSAHPVALAGAHVSTAPIEGFEDVLSAAAQSFLLALHQEFEPRRTALLERRRQRQAAFDQGELPGYLKETQAIRETEWRVGPIPEELRDRRVEITGPVDRKMVINALNSGARVYMADFEDSHSPTWRSTLEGQRNLYDAVSGTIEFRSPQGKEYRLNHDTAVLMVRPRGWHLTEKHFTVDGEPISASLFDFALYLFHNAEHLIEKGSGPYFYLPKLESYLEARLWHDVFAFSERQLDLPEGTIKATVLIETLPAVFQMEEILYELRPYITGLNCGRWDYIFSFIKTFRAHPDFVLPDRHQVIMTTHFLRSYSLSLIRTCHRRGAYAMGGMAAQIPIRDDEAENQVALSKVRADKLREARDGHDGTWVAHPGLVPVAMEVFNEHMPSDNQLDRACDDIQVSADDLLQVPEGEITEHGLRNNVHVALRYLAAWLGGHGAVPIHQLMEDAATAEIARTQIWQWINHPAGILADGRRVTMKLFEHIQDEEQQAIREELGEEYDQPRYARAAEILSDITHRPQLEDFLTTVAYRYLD